MRIVAPQPRHVPSLVQLSQAFAREADWAAEVPIGQMNAPEMAYERLLGPAALKVLVAETETGEMAGYVGVYKEHGEIYASILIGDDYRQKGVGRRLVAAVFAELPPGLVVEAWVLASNVASLESTPRFGFRLDRVIEDDGREVHVFVRET